MNHPSEFAALFKLPIAERLQLVEDLWDSIAADNEAVPVADDVIKELRERKARYDANPHSGLSREQVQKTMRER